MAGRVLCVSIVSASGHVIVERFFERLSETDQMLWRRRLHEASEPSVADGGAATLQASDAGRVADACGVSRNGENCLAWCRVGDVRFYAVGSGLYDELARASPRPRTPAPRPSRVARRDFLPRPSRHFPPTVLDPSPPVPPTPSPRAVAEVLQAMVDSVGAMAKKHFDEARVFEHYGMICLALDEIVSDGVVEATNWDTIRRGIKLKMSA